VRVRIEGGEHQRLPKALIKRAFAGDDVGDRSPAPCPHERRRGQIIERLRRRHASAAIKKPGRPAAFVDLERPTLPGLKIREVELRPRRTAEFVRAADEGEIPDR